MALIGATVRYAAAVLLPLLLLLSHRNAPAVLVLVGLCGVTALRHVKLPHWAWLTYAALAAFALTCLWSPYKDALAWPPYLFLLGLLMSGAVVTGGGRPMRWFYYAAMLSVLLLGIEAATGGLIRDIVPPENRPDKDNVATARGITIMLGMAPAVFLMVWRRHWWWLGALMAAAVLWASLSFGIIANFLAVVAGGGAAAFTVKWPRAGLGLTMAGAAAGFIFFPLFTMALPSVEVLGGLEAGPASWRMRLVAWKAIWDATADGFFPFVFGHGIEAGRVLGERLGETPLRDIETGANVIPTHPHNIYLQAWYDLGSLGVGVSMAAVLAGRRALIAKVDQLPRDMAAAIAALIASTIVFAAVDASLWTLWRVAGPLLGAFMLARYPHHPG